MSKERLGGLALLYIWVFLETKDSAQLGMTSYSQAKFISVIKFLT